jgi:hypothetical protein
LKWILISIRAIAKPTNELLVLLMNPRLGIESMMNYLSLIAVSSNNTGSLDSDVVDPNYTNIYAPYKLQTTTK